MRTLRERFEQKILRVNSCWEWVGARTNDEQGVMKVEGKLKLATHVAWFLKHGTWPTKQLNHTCDNPPCIRIKHLYHGTQKENIQDMIARGRAPPPRYNMVLQDAAQKVGISRQAVYVRLKKGQRVDRPRYSRE